MLKGLIIGFFCFILFLTIHVLIFHFLGPFEKRFRIIKNIFFALIPVYIVLYILIPADILVLMPADQHLTSKAVLTLSKILNFSVGFMLYAFLFMGYCQFYFIVDRSVSARILIEIENSPEKKLTFEGIAKAYDMEDKIKREIEDLLNVKFIKEENGYYRTLPRGYLYSSMIMFLKKFLNLGRGG